MEKLEADSSMMYLVALPSGHITLQAVAFAAQRPIGGQHCLVEAVHRRGPLGRIFLLQRYNLDSIMLTFVTISRRYAECEPEAVHQTEVDLNKREFENRPLTAVCHKSCHHFTYRKPGL